MKKFIFFGLLFAVLGEYVRAKSMRKNKGRD